MQPLRLNPGDGHDALLLAHRWAGPFLVTHKRYSRAFRQPWHEHEAASVDFVLAGAGEGVYAGRRVESRAGAVEFFRQGVRHDFRSGPGGIRSLHLMVPPALVDRRAGEVAVRELDATRCLRLAVRLLGELGEPDASSGLAIESIGHEVLGEVMPAARQRRRCPRWLERAREALHADEAPGLARLSDEVGVSPGHLARAFRARWGCSAGEYHRRVRLGQAARRLAGSRDALARIAQEAGFFDQAHFTRAFAAYAGVTPGRFRGLIAKA